MEELEINDDISPDNFVNRNLPYEYQDVDDLEDNFQIYD